MHIVLGISATETDVTAALVDSELPQLGPVDDRVTRIESGVGDAVAAAVGVMLLRAARADLTVEAAAVAYQHLAQRSAIAHALERQYFTGVELVDSATLDPAFPTAVSAAIWSAERYAEDEYAADGPAMAALPATDPRPVSNRRRSLTMVGAGIAAAVLAGSVAVWSVASAQPPETTGASQPLTPSTSAAPSTTSTTPVAPVPSTAPPTPAPGEESDPASVPDPFVAPEQYDEFGNPTTAFEDPALNPGVTTRPRATAVPRSTSGSSPATGGSSSGGTSSGGTSGGGTSGGGSGGGSGTGTGGGGTGTGTGGGTTVDEGTPSGGTTPGSEVDPVVPGGGGDAPADGSAGQ